MQLLVEQICKRVPTHQKRRKNEHTPRMQDRFSNAIAGNVTVHTHITHTETHTTAQPHNRNHDKDKRQKTKKKSKSKSKKKHKHKHKVCVRHILQWYACVKCLHVKLYTEKTPLKVKIHRSFYS